MRHLTLLSGLVLSASLLGACQADGKKEKDKKGEANKAGETTKTNENANNANASPAASSPELDSGFYTGIDGKSKFSLLLPGFRAYTVADPSIAKVEAVQVKLSEATINELIEDRKKKNPGVDIERFKKQFARTQTAYKLTPLKAGKTTLTTQGRGGGKSSWSKASKIALVVIAYPDGLVAKGKARYERAGTNTKRACKSCHETGEQGAPPHALGHVMDISDPQVLEWVKTGHTGERTASIPHAWDFENAEEEKGIVAYLRTLQTDDVEQLTKLMFENAFMNFPGGGGPGGPGGGKPATE